MSDLTVTVGGHDLTATWIDDNPKTRSALADALRVRALARELDAGLVRVVLNRATDAAAVESVADRLGAPVITVPDDDAIARAQAAGQPVHRALPESDANPAFETLANAVDREVRPKRHRT